MFLAKSLSQLFFDNFIGENNRWLISIGKGLGVTLAVTSFAVACGLVIGSLMAVLRVSYQRAERKNWLLKIGNAIANLYITVIRGTPVALQLLIIYMVVFKFQGNGILVGGVAFGINSGAYVAEIIRGGILAVDKGQTEAGLSLGLSNATVMTRIVAPQALKTVLPSLGNEFIAVLKETAILGTVSVYDLTFVSQNIISYTRDYLFNLCGVAVLYLAIVLLLTYLLKLLERRLAKSDK